MYPSGAIGLIRYLHERTPASQSRSARPLAGCRPASRERKDQHVTRTVHIDVGRAPERVHADGPPGPGVPSDKPADEDSM
jgi:hypothetical protein